MPEGGFYMKDTMTGTIASLIASGNSGARAAMESMVDEIVGYAQDNAPWADRTGAARQGLVAEVTEEQGELYLELAHTVDYGQWLEVIQSGRFAIIMPTLEVFAPEVFRRAGATFTEEVEEE